MATETLSRDDIAFGRAVLLATDAFGLAAEGALWLYDAASNEWRYFLVTSLFEQIGPLEMYRRLDEGFRKTLSENEMTDFSFYIAGPNEKIIRDIRQSVRTTTHASEPILSNVKIDGKSVEAWIYRIAIGHEKPQVKAAQRRFKKRIKELQAA
ncbi:MAG TPA: hypothetical protein VM689_07070 [Aliidongia sp.]|nr:hypothetical protein [Aliidongia sp.]